MQNRRLDDITFEHFVRNSFMDLLADANLHAYYEIADYVQTRSQAENRTWRTGTNNISNALKGLL